MRKTQSLFFLALVLLFQAADLYSQEDSSAYNKGLSVEILSISEKCDIYFSDSRIVKDVSLGGVQDSNFFIYKEGFSSRSFDIGSIKKIVFKNHGFWAGAGYGFLGSVLFWGTVGLVAYKPGGEYDFGRGFGFLIGVVLGVPTALITGLVTEFATQDDIYTFPGNNLEAKTKRLKYILNKHRK